MPSSVAESVAGGIFLSRPEPQLMPVGGSQGLTLMSDLHIGAPHVDYPLINRELEAAKANGDRILLNGDVFDMILVGDRKRYSADVIHPRLQGRNDVISAAVQWAAEILAPYAEQIDLLGIGNHEAMVTRYHSVDPGLLLLYELEKALPAKTKHCVHYGGYTGFVDYRFRTSMSRHGPEERFEGGKRYVIYYHHGSGATAPVTKGMIDFARKDVFIDADLLWLGHKHNRWAGHVQRLSCPLIGDDVLVRDVRHVMTGAYFKTYQTQSQKSLRRDGRRSNYAADAGLAPQGLGGARVLLGFPTRGRPIQVTVTQ